MVRRPRDARAERDQPGCDRQRVRPVHWEGRALLMNLLNIEVPVIAAMPRVAAR